MRGSDKTTKPDLSIMYTLSTALSPLSPRTRNNLRCAPMYLLMVISTMINLMTSAAPVTKPDDDDDKSITGTARDGPYNITVQAGIAGAILIIAGFLLCFFGYRLFHVTMFLIGFYFFGNISYIGMANGGVTSETLLLIISIVVGILGGLLLICCSRLGVAVLGALALYSLGLWILGWQSGGVITSRVGRGILLGVLAVNTVDNRVSLDAKQYALLATFIVMALLGMAVQFRAWGRRRFYPAGSTPAGSNVVYTEKPSRFGGFFRRRY
ncbi:hypothetical protein CPC16_011314 [Podila verticillata]|nr:hypothetical protein CPC16_011314 [Podila verticillata]